MVAVKAIMFFAAFMTPRKSIPGSLSKVTIPEDEIEAGEFEVGTQVSAPRLFVIGVAVVAFPLSSIVQSFPLEGPREVAERLVADAARFRGGRPADDDTTLMVVRRTA